MKLPKADGRPPRKDNKRIGLHRRANLENEDVHDPEAAGYTACAMETLRFLSAQGLPPDHPMVKAITERLLRDRD
ncbi:hypothetical protein NQ314_006601 [Rhamnusium bicolor]|uniref:Uncharacterized protein n=1 Tax=Rhamnusium bicolor TaxID=1586634 RepID=A0AAV8Z167_9CUCU|nr:hypothetical protein NQ314_006601 [Rhamnusium bicolor]